MAGPITISGNLTADNTDILSGTRLQSAPRNGAMTFEVISNKADTTNNFTTSIQLPNGDTPWDAVLVPGNNPSLAGAMDDRQKLQGTYPVQQGGHVVFSVDETGTATLTYRVTFTPSA